MVKEVPHVNCGNLMQVMYEDKLPMSLDNMRKGCKVLTLGVGQGDGEEMMRVKLTTGLNSVSGEDNLKDFQ